MRFADARFSPEEHGLRLPLLHDLVDLSQSAYIGFSPNERQMGER